MYMPTDCGPASYDDYLNTLGELEGFIDSVILLLLLAMLILIQVENMRNC